MRPTAPFSPAIPGAPPFRPDRLLRSRREQSAWTADRAEFIGHNGALEAPAALVHGGALSGTVGAGLDPCAALATSIELGAGKTAEIVWLLGQCGSVEDARALIARTRETDLDTVLASVADHWETLLGAVRVKTPDRTMDLMLNGWLLYQTLACRVLARSAFYQASGAYGFRDQLQDTMALSFAAGLDARHLLRAAARQFIEGDVQHWWLPHSGRGRPHTDFRRPSLARLRCRDYITASGDTAVLDDTLCRFSREAPLGRGEHDAFFQPMFRERAGVAVRALRPRARPVPRPHRRSTACRSRYGRLERWHEPGR